MYYAKPLQIIYLAQKYASTEEKDVRNSQRCDQNRRPITVHQTMSFDFTWFCPKHSDVTFFTLFSRHLARCDPFIRLEECECVRMVPRTVTEEDPIPANHFVLFRCEESKSVSLHLSRIEADEFPPRSTRGIENWS